MIMTINTLPDNTTEVLLDIMQTRVESARINLDLSPAAIDVQLVVDRSMASLDSVLCYVATITTPGHKHEALTFRAPATPWSHLLRSAATWLPPRPKAWLLTKVRYTETKVSCLDIWPKFELPPRHGECVRSITSPQWHVSVPGQPLCRLEHESKVNSVIEL